MARFVPVVVIVAGAVLALATLAGGLDYYVDPAGSIDALVRGDWNGFFAEQPLMGSLSLVLRAPFVALVFDADIETVYYAGVLPCLAVLVVLTFAVLRRMEAAGRTTGDRAVVALLCLGTLPLMRSIHWGHPEEILASALVIAGMLAAGGSRPAVAGVLIGLAFASKQWALLAVLPALLVLTRGRIALLAAAGITVAVFTLPMLVGNPDRFFDVLRAAGSIDPQYELGMRERAPGAHVNPQSVFLPFAKDEPFQDNELLFVSEAVARFAHPAILLIGFTIPLLLWRRAGRLPLLAGLRLLALVFALRGVLDPMSLDYYHLPLVLALAAAAAVGGRRDVRLAVWATAGLTLAFAEPAVGVPELEQHAGAKFLVYMATMVPLIYALGRGLLADTKRASRSDLAHASTSSAKRRSRVSGRLASESQNVTVLR